MMKFTSPSQEFFFSKNDPQDVRLGELFQFPDGKPSDNPAPGISILGYPDDDGIQKNGGRIGAAEGPDQIRRWLYRMSAPTNSNFSFEDLGNLSDFKNEVLEARHEAAIKKVREHLRENRRVVSLGGGHDYGYADGAAFLKSIGALQNPAHHPITNQSKPLIINFDAHLDVRSTNKGINSGTPFYRLKEEFKDFDLIQVGIQKQCNSPAHLNWCEENKIEVLMLDEFFGNELSLQKTFLNRFRNHLHIDRPTYVSVDIDGFSWAYAPGCSQSWPTGMEPKDFFPLFDLLLKNLDVRLLSIYELSPPLDIQFGTAKLASQIAYKFIDHQVSAHV